nr:MAG TPA: hypothetical protein [Caudoviricetes sp.]
MREKGHDNLPKKLAFFCCEPFSYASCSFFNSIYTTKSIPFISLVCL